MLVQAKKKNSKYLNIDFINEDLKSLIFFKKVDTILAISSIFPENYLEFDIIFLEHIKEFVKKKETIIDEFAFI